MNARRATLLRMLFAVFALLQMIRTSLAAGDGPIVYSARYYNPSPTMPGTTYWHLYRINSDGTGRRQVTFGNYDDTEPRWSPDGKWIAFLRTPVAKGEQLDEMGGAQVQASLCLVSENGGKVRPLSSFGKKAIYLPDPPNAWSPDGKRVAVFVYGDDSYAQSCISLIRRSDGNQQNFPQTNAIHWSPDSRHIALERAADSNQTTTPTARNFLVDLVTGKRTELPAASSAYHWCDAQTLVAALTGASPGVILLLNAQGKETQRVSLPQPLTGSMAGSDDTSIYVTARYPPDHETILFGMEGGESTNGHFTIWRRFNLKTGTVADFTPGKFLAWSANSTKFCTIVNRGLQDYGHRDGQDRTVWVQSLDVGDGATGKTKPIVDGLVYVVGADWRPR